MLCSKLWQFEGGDRSGPSSFLPELAGKFLLFINL